MSLSDCPNCYETPCICSTGYLGSRNHAYEELQKERAALRTKLDEAMKELGNNVEAMTKVVEFNCDEPMVVLESALTNAQDFLKKAGGK